MAALLLVSVVLLQSAELTPGDRPHRGPPGVGQAPEMSSWSLLLCLGVPAGWDPGTVTVSKPVLLTAVS